MKIYERKSFPRMSRDLKAMLESGKLSFDNAVQRSFVWKNTTKDNRMSMLIDTMLRGFPIPPMYCNCIFTTPNDKVYDFIDGKQRVTTIVKYLNNEFSLINIPVFEMEDDTELDLNGKTYVELPSDFQDIVKTYSLTVYYYDNMEQDDVEEMFLRFNNGKSLSAIELTRANAKSKEQIITLSTHPIFTGALNEKAIARYANEDIVIKTWILMYGENKSFETKNVRPVMKDTVISEEQESQINRVFDKFMGTHKLLAQNENDSIVKKVCKKMFTKTHMVSLMPVVNRSIEDNIPVDKVAEWVKHFFTANKAATISQVYNDNATTGSAKVEAVKARHSELMRSYEDFVGNEN